MDRRTSNIKIKWFNEIGSQEIVLEIRPVQTQLLQERSFRLHAKHATTVIVSITSPVSLLSILGDLIGK